MDNYSISSDSKQVDDEIQFCLNLVKMFEARQKSEGHHQKHKQELEALNRELKKELEQMKMKAEQQEQIFVEDQMKKEMEILQKASEEAEAALYHCRKQREAEASLYDYEKQWEARHNECSNNSEELKKKEIEILREVTHETEAALHHHKKQLEAESSLWHYKKQMKATNLHFWPRH